MRFHPDGPSIPDILLEQCDAGRVVFLCGAGVSLPSGMPTFVGLTQHVIEFFDPPADSEIMAAFRPWLDGSSAANTPLDQIFNLLHLEYGKDEVNALVTERLNAPLEVNDLGREHNLIKRISSSQSGVPQIVTTNFDRLFEAGKEGGHLVVHVPPAFPDLNYGSKIEGITYLHGRLVEADSENHPYVLSSADFGRAYLSEGWATSFIRHLLERYTVVLVGYQAEDPPIKYLLQGLNHDGQYDRSKLYAFDRGLPEEIEVKWRDRGVTAIAYSKHPDLWRSLEAWADRADDPRRWRASIIAKSLQDPKELAPYERGQVAHVLRTVQGARLFSEADPAPHPEWVCVMDANIRSARQSRSYGANAETFDPSAAYGLDDDLMAFTEDDRKLGVSNDNILIWRDEDDNPHDVHRLGDRQPEGFEAVPKRLGHLMSWIRKSLDSPVLAWWAIRKSGLHPRLLHEIDWHIEHGTDLHKRARQTWRLILEYHRDPRNREFNGDWFGLKKLIAKEGWGPSALREFRRVTLPRVDIRSPFGLAQSKPPTSTWEEVQLSHLGEFEVKFLDRHNEDLEIPDDMLPAVISILQEQLTIASGLLVDIEPAYIGTPTCYPDRDIFGRERWTDDAEITTWFIELFDRMTGLNPELANAYAMVWPMTDQFFFRKLKLYAFNKAKVFDADFVANSILAFDQEAFWSSDTARELLFLLVDRWREFSKEHRNRITDRILSGPDQPSYLTDDEHHDLRDRLIARYARYLEIKGCDLTENYREQLTGIIRGISEWDDGWATSTVTRWGSQGGWIRTDEAPGELVSIPVNQVIATAKGDHKRDLSSLTERRPFTGLVKASPRKALSALTIAGRDDDYPETFWSSMINELPVDIAPRLRRVFLNRLARLPHVVIAKLRHTLGRWLEKNLAATLEFDDALGWAVYDHIVDGILSGGADTTKSGLGEIRQGGQAIQRSRRTLDHATNSPIGMCTEAIFHAVPSEGQEAGSLIPSHIKIRIERLFAAPGEGSDHAVSIVCRKLNWLLFVDPVWTEESLIPMLELDHPASEPAWNGFLHCQQVPWPPLAAIIKPLLLRLFPWIEDLSWNQDLSNIAAQWLGFMRVSHPNEQCGLSRIEMRLVLRAMSDKTRNRFIFWLGLVGKENENGWARYVIPLVNEDWPRERRYRTSASMTAWIGLLVGTRDSFPIVYEAVKKFIGPVETNNNPLYRLTLEDRDEKPITVLFPETTLDLMNRVTPQVLTHTSYELSKVLALIAETEPNLTSDPRYLRLIDLVERS